MPWKVEKRGDEFAVVSKESGKVEGKHDTRAKAEAQVRALYSSEDKKTGMKKANRARQG